MEIKDQLSLSVSTLALFVSVSSFIISALTFYFTNFHKKAKAFIVLNSRLFGFKDQKQVRELEYAFCNTGNIELFVRDINIFRGMSNLGPARHNSSFLYITALGGNESFIIKPKEIKIFTLLEDMGHEYHPDYDLKKNKYKIVCLEVISAKGERYEIAHDISDLLPSGIDSKHVVWDAVSLGKVLR